MWYAVETVFIDGQLFDSHCFDYGKKTGICHAGDWEEPLNSCKKECLDRIEIHTDWFESEELAEDFKNGKITFIHHYDAYYKKSINSTLTKFTKREIVKVDVSKGIFPHKGIYEKHPLDYKPYWVR